MQTGDVTLETADGPMRVYEAIPEGGGRAAVIVIQEAFGVNGHIEDVTRRLATAGYRAAAPELFHRAGAGATAPYDDFSKVLPLFEGLDDDGILTDVDATVAHLRAAGFEDDRIGLVGFCMGGRATFLVAVRRRLGAAVGFYGGGIVTARFPQFPALVEESANLRTPWLGLFGDEDASIPVADVEALGARLEAEAPSPHDIVRYPGAEHGFHCDVRPSYDDEAAADGWARTLGWFAEHLAG